MRPPLVKPIKVLFNEFLAESSNAEKSKQIYLAVFKTFSRWSGRNEKSFRSLTLSDMVAFREHLISAGRSANTINLYITILKLFFTWLFEHYEYPNIMQYIRRVPASPEFRKQYLVPEKVKDLLLSISNDSLIGKRDFAIINLMVRTGLRCIEVTRLNVSDLLLIDDSTPVIAIQRKGRIEKTEFLGLTPKAYGPIVEYLDARGIELKSIQQVVKIQPDQSPENIFTALIEKSETTQESAVPLFVNHANASRNTRMNPNRLGTVVKARLNKIGLTSRAYTAHSLRHTAACNALDAGVSIYDVKVMLGHASVKTTELYLKMIANRRSLANGPGIALDKLF